MYPAEYNIQMVRKLLWFCHSPIQCSLVAYTLSATHVSIKFYNAKLSSLLNDNIHETVYIQQALANVVNSDDSLGNIRFITDRCILLGTLNMCNKYLLFNRITYKFSYLKIKKT